MATTQYMFIPLYDANLFVISNIQNTKVDQINAHPDHTHIMQRFQLRHILD